MGTVTINAGDIPKAIERIHDAANMTDEEWQASARVAPRSNVLDELSKPVGADNKLSWLDKRLLSLAQQGMSGFEMAEELDGQITPAAAIIRVREILSSNDVFTQVEQRALVMRDLIDLKNILIQRVKDEGGVVTNKDGEEFFSLGDPRWSANLTKVLRQIDDLIERGTKDVRLDQATLRRDHAMLMMRAIELAFKEFLRQVQDAYPDVEEKHLRAFLEFSVPAAIATIEARTDGAEAGF